MTINKYTKKRLKDYPITCDICSKVCWFSESSKLDVYTGRGGLRVCPSDKDKIHYGFKPYKIRAESPVVDTRTNSYFDNTNISGTEPFDYSTYPEGMYNNTTQDWTWENININWEDIDTNWEDMI